MLTKEERAAIAGRAVSFNGDALHYTDIYKCLLGEYPQSCTSFEDDDKAILDRILDLCDTSNMVELPVDKDGEVICPGDTVYVDDDMKYKVAGYMMRGNSIEVILATGTESVYTKEPANNITHKKPVTIASLVKELTDLAAADYGTPMVVKRKLSDIADQLERLGDNDE